MDERACDEHEWRLVEVVLQMPGSLSTYTCTRCEAVLPVPSGQMKPGTV
jgi:hypothetical protein